MHQYANSLRDALLSAGIENDISTLEWCLCRTARFYVGSRAIPVFTKVEFGRGEKPIPREVVQFNCLQLKEVLLADTKNAIKWLIGGHYSNFTDGDMHFLRKDSQWGCVYPTSTWHSHFSAKKPCYIFSQNGFCEDDAPQEKKAIFSTLAQEVQSAELNGPREEQFYCVVDAIDWWMNRNVSIAHSGSFSKPVIEVTFPLPPGHIRELLFESGQLIVHMEPGLKKSMKVSLAFRQENEFHWSSVQSQNDKAAFGAIPDGHFRIIISDGDNTICNYKGESRFIHSLDSPPDANDTLNACLRNGERETVEFKEILNRKTKELNFDVIKEDIPRVVSSMANTQGGFLFVGVTDDGDVIGMDECMGPLSEKFKCTESEVKDYLVACLKRQTAGHFSNAPQCQYTWVRADNGKEVLMLEITKNPPGIISEYSSKETLVRRGSSRYPATVSEIAALLRRPTGDTPFGSTDRFLS